MDLEILNGNKMKSEELKKFLKKVCDEFVKELKIGYDELKENPLYYRERTLSSYFFPVLMRTSRRALMEVYFEKQNEDEEKLIGRHADFYALSKEGDISYIIEFKQAWNEIGAPNELIKKRWDTVNSQIDDLNKDNVKKIDSGKKIYGISFMVIPTINKIGKKNKECKEELDLRFNNELSNAHWSYTWKVSGDIKEGFDEDKFEYLTFVGQVKNLNR